ncbi:MAG: COX15/CtaA family protein [Bryobacteraceae bacterium]
MPSSWLHRYALLVAACTLCLVVAGALVTSNEAGLSVPDWPLSYGKLMPEMTGGIFYEHGHRMVATTVGMLTIILAIWVWRADERPWMRRLGWGALAAVVAQGILGGLTVIFLLPKPVSISHACLAQLFFSTTVAIAVFTSPSWREGAPLVADTAGLRSLAFAVPGTLFVQVALGAAFRHKALALAPHVLGAVLATVVVLSASHQILRRFPDHRPLRTSMLAVLAATMTQIFLGIAAFMARVATADAPQPLPVMVVWTVAHVAVGSVALASSIVFGIQVLRYVKPARVGYAIT